MNNFSKTNKKTNTKLNNFFNNKINLGFINQNIKQKILSNQNLRIALYCGSFDPFTNGHLDIVKEASPMFDILIIGIAYNSQKNKRTFSTGLMRDAIEESMKEAQISNVIVTIYHDLTKNIVKDFKAHTIIRGFRDHNDIDYENRLAITNSRLAKTDNNFDVRTIYIQSTEELNILSSSLIREKLSYKEDVSQYLPRPILKAISGKMF